MSDAKSTADDQPLPYLSDGWFDAVTEAVEASGELASLASDHTIRATNVAVVSGEEISYHFCVEDDRVEFGRGPANRETVRFTQGLDTAVQLAAGTVNAQQLLIDGRLRFSGDPDAVVNAVPVFVAFAAAIEPVMKRTEFG